uniref:Uncharacterized protein n=1 Tax=Anguilla anguilla TaxID=7936 RepID=A0A0E9UK91_ANGAN
MPFLEDIFPDVFPVIKQQSRTTFYFIFQIHFV